MRPNLQRKFDQVMDGASRLALSGVAGRRQAALRCAVIACLGFILACGAPADAHVKRKNASNEGIAIPNLSHGQLRVIAKYRTAILDLANLQLRPHPDTRTIQNFVNLQFTYCLWGLVPGSLANEDSPFNACTHAYLAASKALLHQLERTSANHSAVRDLATQINIDMIREETALEICANGVDPFNTADVVMPEWSGLSFNPIVLLYTLIAFAVTGLLFALHFMRRRERSTAGPAAS